MVIIITVLLGLIYFVFTPTVRKLSDCIEQGNQQLMSNKQQAINEQWNKQQICIKGRDMILSVSSCYEIVGDSSMVPVSFIESIAKLIKPDFFSMENMIQTHNNGCADVPEAAI